MAEYCSNKGNTSRINGASRFILSVSKLQISWRADSGVHSNFRTPKRAVSETVRKDYAAIGIDATAERINGENGIYN